MLPDSCALWGRGAKLNTGTQDGLRHVINGCLKDEAGNYVAFGLQALVGLELFFGQFTLAIPQVPQGNEYLAFCALSGPFTKETQRRS